MISLEHITQVCSTDPHRSNLAKPFRVTVDDKSWIVGTDGMSLLAAQCDADVADGMPITSEAAAEYISKALAVMAIEVKLADLRSWAGSPLDLTPRKCEDCHGSGECKCLRCEEEADGDCYRCDGDGIVDVVVPETKSFLMDRLCNATRLANLIQHFPGDSVGIAVGDVEDPIMFRGMGWIALLMPMRRTDDDAPEEIAAAPRFACGS